MSIDKGKRTPIITRRGDGGYTSLWGGDEVAKYDSRPEAYGTVDEATALVGQARAQTAHPEITKELLRLQYDLFRLMSELASGDVHTQEISIGAAQVSEIEARIVQVRDGLDLPAMFTVAATPTSAVIDVARTVIRRAERLVARMLHEGVITNGDTLRYLNRASDLAFLLARLEEQMDGVPYLTIGAEDLL